MKSTKTRILIIFFLLMISPLKVLARAGGGGGGFGGGGGGYWGHGGGYGSGSAAPYTERDYLAFLMMALGTWGVYLSYKVYRNQRITHKEKQIEEILAKLALTDPSWSKSNLAAVIRQSFFDIQKAWCDQNLVVLKKSLGSGLYSEWESKIKDFKECNQKNVMDDLSLDKLEIVDIKNYRDKSKDTFTVCIDAGATDYYLADDGAFYDANYKRVLGRDSLSYAAFREYWIYRFSKNGWLLQSVEQADAWDDIVDENIVDET